MPATRIAVLGAAGRMGRQVTAAIAATPDAELGAAIVLDDEPARGEPVDSHGVAYAALADAQAACTACQVLVAFTTPDAIGASLACADRHGLALVLGTTGMDDGDRQQARALAAKVPVLAAANMSLGTNVLFHLVAVAARLVPGWDAEVFDIHHRAKVDAPSGTAMHLGEVLRQARADGSEVCLDRTGRRAPRADAEIGMAVMRAGDVVGEHTVLLAGTGERLEITHRATDRSNFAAGAVKAALFLAGRQPGMYTMADVLGLPTAG